MSIETGPTSAAAVEEVVADIDFEIDILEPTKEILRCYDERINPLESLTGAITQVQNKRMLEHIADFTQEDVLARVGRISDEFRKRIERVDTVDRLDRRVCELEKENESLRIERDSQASELRVVFRQVDTFLDVVESFLDADYDREKMPYNSTEEFLAMERRASSSSVVSKAPVLTIKSRPEPERRIDRDKGSKCLSASNSSSNAGRPASPALRPSRSAPAENLKGKRAMSPGIQRPIPAEKEKGKQRAMSPGIRAASSSPRNLNSKMSITVFDKGKQRAVSPGIRTASPSPKNMSTNVFNKEKGNRAMSPGINQAANQSPKKAYMNLTDTRKRKWPESERHSQEAMIHGKVVLPTGVMRWKG